MAKRKERGNKIWLYLAIFFSVIALVAAGILLKQWVDKKEAEDAFNQLAEQTNGKSQEEQGRTEPEKEPEELPVEELEEPERVWSEYTLEEKYQAYQDIFGIEVPQKNLNFQELHENSSPDIYAWVYVPGTNVDYPVLRHPTDDSYYLDYNMDGTKGYPGCIYSESCNSKDFTDRMTVLYGHNMRTGTMFGSLHNFEDRAVFDENRYIYIYLPDDIRVYEIFAAYEGSSTHIIYGHEWTDESYVQYLSDTLKLTGEKDNVLDSYEFAADDLVLTLSTCIRNVPNKRYLVQGILLEPAPGMGGAAE